MDAPRSSIRWSATPRALKRTRIGASGGWSILGRCSGRAEINPTRNYQALEREYIEGTMSLRELCRRHDIVNSSSVNVQKKRRGWDEKRELFRNRTSALTIEKTADKVAARMAKEMDVRDDIVEAIHKAVLKMTADMDRTKKVKDEDGSFHEEPVLIFGPNELVKLIDRLNVLFGRPSTITEERNLGVSFGPEFGLKDLQGILDATRGAQSISVGGTPLPRLADTGPD